MTELRVGQRVVANRTITEGSTPPSPTAKFPHGGYVHAVEGDVGYVEGIDDDCATVRFERTGTATVVGDHEVAT